MDPSPGGSWNDPFEDPREVDPPPTPDPYSPYSTDDGWISGKALSEILYLESMLRRAVRCCPRCGGWRFAYGPVEFCSHGCPENLLLTLQGEPGGASRRPH